MPYASASGGSVERAPLRLLAAPAGRWFGEDARGDMTGVRVTSPRVVIALGSRLPDPDAVRAPAPGRPDDLP